MGTSTVHRSPQTSHWRIVNNLYNNPSVPQERILAELFRATEQPYRLALGGQETAQALSLAVGSLVGRAVPAAEALPLSRRLVAENRQTTNAEGGSPFLGDLANRALHATVLSVTAQRTANAADVVQQFLGHVVATCIDHVVTRDISAHVGKLAIPTAGAALKLTAELKTAAKNIAGNESLQSDIAAAAKAPSENWQRLITRTWRLGAASRAIRPKGKR